MSEGKFSTYSFTCRLNSLFLYLNEDIFKKQREEEWGVGKVVEIAIKIFQRWKTRKSNYVSQKINAVVIFLEATTSPLQITRFLKRIF